MKTRTVVTAVIKKGDKLLFGRKPKDVGPYPNTWHLLGGGVNEDEDFIDALRREIQEEAGITVKNIKKIGIDEDDEPNKHGEMMHFIFHIYEAEYESGEPTPNDDIVELKWFPKEEFASLSLPRPSLKFFRKVGFI